MTFSEGSPGEQKVTQGCYVEMIKKDQKRANSKGKAVDASA